MMPAQKLKTFLDENKVKYMTISHSKAYTSQEIAARTHIPGIKMAKTVMIKIDGKLVMAVLPASYHVDLDTLRQMFATSYVNIAREPEFMNRFPDCEIGAMPPFGNLYDLDVYMAETLTKDDEIAFNAGSHSELFQMKYADYRELVNPRIFKFSEKNVSFSRDPRERWNENYTGL
jgi:Ala-tRNA(Pro) deacylase